jgi:DNA-binding NtrC family response regulator
LQGRGHFAGSQGDGTMKPMILLIDDDEGTLFGFSKYLSGTGYEVVGASTLKEAQESLDSHRFDTLLLDLNLPDGNGIDWIPVLKKDYPEIPVVVITGKGDIPIAVEAMRRGAVNFLTKPVDMASLDIFLHNTLELGALRKKHYIEKRLTRKQGIYFGNSALLTKAKELALLASESDVPVLISGETGTGKGILARWIHDNGERRAQPYVEINCSGLRSELLASELFGSVRGAFTSAFENRWGLIEVADRGTLFLDEIGDMDNGVQSAFLKVIEEKTFRRIGDTKLRKSDFRLICATNRDLEKETQEGSFRKDLFFRIRVFPISLPPLREIPEDVHGFARYFAKSLGYPDVDIRQEVIHHLRAYSWPGNIRELLNILERALILARGGPLTMEHFPGLLSPPFGHSSDTRVVAMQESSLIAATLEECQGDVSKAAKALGISRATMYRKLKKQSYLQPSKAPQ